MSISVGLHNMIIIMITIRTITGYYTIMSDWNVPSHRYNNIMVSGYLYQAQWKIAKTFECCMTNSKFQISQDFNHGPFNEKIPQSMIWHFKNNVKHYTGTVLFTRLLVIDPTVHWINYYQFNYLLAFDKSIDQDQRR